MDTLHARLAELADDAPTGGVPATELWARGKRAHRLRTVALAAIVVVVVGAVGAGVAVRLADGDGRRSAPATGGTPVIGLPIDYPVGDDLPQLGTAPGPLAAIWVDRVRGGAPRAVGLVADTGRFGTLPIDPPYSEEWPTVGIALSPDGRRIAYSSPRRALIVRDLVSGEISSPAFTFKFREGYTWFDATHLVGHVASGSDLDGWVWEPGAEPKRVDLVRGSRWDVGAPWAQEQLGDPRSCSSPIRQLRQGKEVPLLCDVVGVIGSEVVLTHWSSEVVALDRADIPFDDPAERRVVVTAGAPERVTFATDLIGKALDSGGGAP